MFPSLSDGHSAYSAGILHTSAVGALRSRKERSISARLLSSWSSSTSSERSLAIVSCRIRLMSARFVSRCIKPRSTAALDISNDERSQAPMLCRGRADGNRCAEKARRSCSRSVECPDWHPHPARPGSCAICNFAWTSVSIKDLIKEAFCPVKAD